jgi:osmoprotectant transport system permease protein
MRAQLEKSGVGMTGELGFNNTYALVMQRTAAVRLQIHKISDLPNHPELKFGLTHEFLDRRDGWRPLAEKYQLPTQNVSGIDHGLGYAALRNGEIDVKDAYSTDAKIGENDLVVLEDDRQFFPQYKAVFLYRLALPANVIAVLRKLEGTLDQSRMIQLNVEAERTKNYEQAADLYFRNSSSPSETRTCESLKQNLNN